MILDSTLIFDGVASTPTTPIAITVTRDSTNILDMSVNRDMSIGTPLYLNMFSNGLFAAAGAATLTIALQGAPNNAGVPGTWTTYLQSTALAIADLNSSLDYLFQTPLPSPPAGTYTDPRFYKLVYTVATGPFTAGAILAYLSHARGGSPTYPAGYSNTYV